MLNSYRTLACCAYQLVLTDDSIRISRDEPDPEFSDPAGSGSGQDPQNPPDIWLDLDLVHCYHFVVGLGSQFGRIRIKPLVYHLA